MPSWSANMTMNGVMSPSISPGSKYFGVSVMCTPHVSCPSGAADTGPARSTVTSSEARTRTRNCVIAPSLALELQILIGRRVWEIRHGAEAVEGHARADAIQEGGLDDGREHHAIVNELLDLVQDLLADARVRLVRLLGEEPVD